MIPLGMAEGDAAGVAAAYAKNNGMTFREISQNADAVTSIQQSLREQGAYLEQWEPIVMDVETHWAYEGVKTLRSLGLVYGGYANDYRLDEPMTIAEADNLLTGLAGDVLTDVWPYSEYVTVQDILDASMKLVTSVNETEGMTAREWLTKADILTEQLQPYFADDAKVPNRAEVIMLLANVREYQISQMGFTVYNSDGTSYEAPAITK